MTVRIIEATTKEVTVTTSLPTARRRSTRQPTAYLYLLPALVVIVGITYFGIGYNGWV
ncbi:MAG: hypothetical protein VB036_17790 [Propionicimonas sp.]|nr:hypothetical protein [Propionicimonas sp.]